MLLNIWEFHGNVDHQFRLTSSQHKVRPLELALERPADRVLERLILLWEAPEYIYNKYIVIYSSNAQNIEYLNQITTKST